MHLRRSDKDEHVTAIRRPVLSDTARWSSLAILLPVAMHAAGAPITLIWDPIADVRVAGYTVHYGTASGQYTSSIDVGGTTALTLRDLAGGPTYFFAVTAYAATGEVSPYSAEVAAAAASPVATPVADFTAHPTYGSVPLTVMFVDRSSGTVNTHVWDFGDGNGSAYGSEHPATGTTHTYATPGIYTVRLSAAGPGGTDSITKSNLIVAVPSQPASAYGCPCSLWSVTAIPRQPSVASTAAVNVGVRFMPGVDGYVTAIRFYKGGGNAGPHTADLWNSAGQRLATATFRDESESGWQQVDLPEPVLVKTGTTYIASYHAPHGGHAGDNGYFLKALQAGPLRAPAHSSARANGVYANASSSTFPRNPAKQTNYWVDVVFVPR
jgi:PKD repeat protein